MALVAFVAFASSGCGYNTLTSKQQNVRRSWADVETKFRALMPASGVSSERIEDTLAAIKTLRHAPDVTQVIHLINSA